jgi:integrase
LLEGLAAQRGGQVSVFGKGGATGAIQVPASVWKLITGLRTPKTDATDPVFRSRKERNGALVPWQCSASSGRRPPAPVSNFPFRPTGSATPTPPMLSTAGAPIHLVQATLGHASINTTGRYLHARPNDSSSRFLPL